MVNSCNGCGLCCRLFHINLSKEEYESRKFKTIFQELDSGLSYEEAKQCGANFLAKKDDGSCVYLEGNNCGIHDQRPGVCRKFFCTSKDKKYEKMVEIIVSEDVQKVSSIFEEN